MFLLWGHGALADSDSMSRCDKPSVIESRLKNLFEEFPIHRGVANNGQLVIIYSDQDNTTWTMVRIIPGGYACIIFVGGPWVKLKIIPIPEVKPKISNEEIEYVWT